MPLTPRSATPELDAFLHGFDEADGSAAADDGAGAPFCFCFCWCHSHAGA